MDNYKEIYQSYMSHFFEECTELLIYNENDFNNSFNLYKQTIEQHFNNYIAYKELPSGKVVAMDGVLVVPIDKKEFKHNKKCKLKKHTIYHVCVRKCISDEIGFQKENQYLLVKLLKKKVKDTALEEAAMKALLPVILHVDGIGDFEWKRYRTCSSFDGKISWCGQMVDVELESDGPGTKTANRAIAVLHRIYPMQHELTQEVFHKCAENLAGNDGLIETWQKKLPYITKEEFLKKLSVSLIYIFQDGSVDIEIGLDEMFAEHAMNVEITPEGEIVVNGLIG